MLFPKNVRYKKVQKGSIPLITTKGTKVEHGIFYIKILECGKINNKHLEAIRKILIKKVRKKGKMWFRIFPSVPITRKPIEVRMGKGKGAFSHWVAKVSAGHILVELDNISKNIAKECLKKAIDKLPVKTKLVFLKNFFKKDE